MQRTVYNVWGRWVNYSPAANVRLLQARQKNPKITNQHVAIRETVHVYSATGEKEIRYLYQARWYDRKVAIKEGKARRLQSATPRPRHVCNCEHCDL